MKSVKKNFLGILFDIVCVLIVSIPFALFESGLVDPFERGFFCKDHSLKYPYKESTISKFNLISATVIGPILILLVIEAIQLRAEPKEGKSSGKYHEGTVGIPQYLARIYKIAGVFIFGQSVQLSTIFVIKVPVGRLRPHFFAVCDPMPGNCTDGHGFQRYVTDYECQGAGEEILRESRVSFPSGHASMSFYSMLFLVFYLQYRMKWKFTRLLRPFLQAIFIYAAIWISATRIYDYHHHLSDVVVGAMVGIICASCTSLYVAKMFEEKKNTLLERILSIVRQETRPSAGLNEVEYALNDFTSK